MNSEGCRDPSWGCRRSRISSFNKLAATSWKQASNFSKSLLRIVKPAAIAWPPNFRIRSGSRLETISKASRKWKPVNDLPDPRNSSPVLPSAGAKTIAGRLKRSLRREATIPTTPWCHSGFQRQILVRWPIVPANWSSARWARAASCMPASITRRSRLMRSSSWAIIIASSVLSVSSKRMPKVISAKRPAALRRGPIAKPKSKVFALRGSRLAAWNKACIPAWDIPVWMRFKPLETSTRLLRSSCATSATVPSATRSNRFSILGWVSLVNFPRLRSSARNATNR